MEKLTVRTPEELSQVVPRMTGFTPRDQWVIVPHGPGAERCPVAALTPEQVWDLANGARIYRDANVVLLCYGTVDPDVTDTIHEVLETVGASVVTTTVGNLEPTAEYPLREEWIARPGSQDSLDESYERLQEELRGA